MPLHPCPEERSTVQLSPLGTTTPYDGETAELIARTWWAGLLGGIVSFVFGLLVLSVDWSVSSLAIFVGCLFVLRGIATLAGRPLDGSPRTLTLAVGGLEIGAGVAIVVWPEIGLLTLAVFVGLRLAIGGLVAIVGAVVNRHVPHWWLVLILGLIQLPLGIWALRRPGMTLAILITLVGVWAIVAGIWECVIALEVRREAKRLRETAPPEATPLAVS
jgi:uncharacterized membrane protein HdeD (DUF308 family)